ncbi:DNA-binding response regulator, NarL/FixJ family, contains REC and HTH domains [Dyadobacter sp. SG02]|uniref:helix-turn-helix transcriptional regulator n=1 Tax=Dyadobacter sp. SG02 TaxID=1855291 RepID=UPI0008D57C9E|nr:LuxR C-terminal-related transcriptional regulator [Dyadobacter sp. SG02]SEJ75872.1 DNA-binding response regulator, NarL/FixJ family, contains REC and HTH domains [Dyadobacter sp. SG02]
MKKAFAKVLIANNDSLQTEALIGLLSKEVDLEFRHISHQDHILEACNELNPNFIILGHTMQPAGLVDWICKLQKSTGGAHFISLIPDICPIEIAKLRARCLTTILHVVDARLHLLPTIRNAKQLPYISPCIQAVVGHFPPKDHALRRLSKTELKITSLILGGYSNKCITERLSRSQQTIEGHRKNIKEKLGVTGGKNSLIDHLVPFTSWVVAEVL